MDDAKAILAVIEADPHVDVSSSIGQYQLRPTLLDPIIPQGIGTLARAYLSTHNTACLHNVYAFCSVRGAKLVQQNFPTDAFLITKLRNEMLANDGEDWKRQYVTLLWLSAVVLSPFDLNAIEPNLFDSLYSVALRYLGVSGIQREAASVLMARLLTRGPPSSHAPLVDRFVVDSLPYLQVDGSGHGNEFRSIGTLAVLAVVLDRTPIIPPEVCGLINRAAEHMDRGGELWFYNHTVLARYWIKVLGRSGLLKMDEFAELVVAECMTLLDNKSTKIRMSAAKYLARISHKLDLQGNGELADEVTEAVVESLRHETNMETASCDYWSGAMLALAEIARRRRLFTSASLECLVNDVLSAKALHFIQRRLKAQIGSNVRDAACYVCWSLFRYVKADQLLRSQRLALYSTLVSLACLDSEVNVRRAAAAALQEGLGRFGSSHGDLGAEEMFNLMNKINFHTVSLAVHCYGTLGPEFCRGRAAYAKLYIHHGINHSNAEFRRMAANAVTEHPASLHTEIVDLLLSDDSVDLHGKMLALGAIYTTGSVYRIDEARTLLFGPDESDIDTESNLRLLHIAPDRVASFLEGVVSEDAHVIASAEDLMDLLPAAVLTSEIIPLCEHKMAENRLYVACLVRMSQTPESILLRASHLADPKSRALVASRLIPHDDETSSRVLAFLNDYTMDERGDVGSWVREAALLRLQPGPTARKAEIEHAVWRLASESTQKIRLLAAQTLHRLGLLPQLDPEDTARYYYDLLSHCPDSARSVVARGVASSVGAIRASTATIEGSFWGLLRYLERVGPEVESVRSVGSTRTAWPESVGSVGSTGSSGSTRTAWPDSTGSTGSSGSTRTASAVSSGLTSSTESSGLTGSTRAALPGSTGLTGSTRSSGLTGSTRTASAESSGLTGSTRTASAASTRSTGSTGSTGSTRSTGPALPVTSTPTTPASAPTTPASAPTWVLNAVMAIDRSSQSSALDVVRTLRRLVLHGYDFGPAKPRVLAIAYNTTLTRSSEQLAMDAVDILQVYGAWSPRAFNRLLSMVKTHRLGPVRQRCADALFELGVEDEVLETTDWTAAGFAQYAKKLAIETK